MGKKARIKEQRKLGLRHKLEARPQLSVPDGDVPNDGNKYLPHQGEGEKARRRLRVV